MVTKQSAFKIQGKPKRASINFTVALAQVGVRVKVLNRSQATDVLMVAGRGQSPNEMKIRFDYKRSLLVASVFTRRGLALTTDVATHSELRALLNVWNICTY